MATVTHAAVAIPSFTGLKSAGATKLASTSVKLSTSSIMPRMSIIKSSLKNVGVAIAATAASALLASNAMAIEILLGGGDGSLAFVPNDFSISAGDKIVFKNNAGFPHNVVFDEDEIPGGVDAAKISMSEEDLLNAPGETYSVTLTEKGTYSFYCAPHQGAGMSGKVNQFVMPSLFCFPVASVSLFLGDVDTAGYSSASYYTSLGLFVISVPGLWSLIKRSVKSKIVQKTYVAEEKKPPNQLAGEILSFFTRNNFVVTDRGETITFEGMMVPSRGQAALLTFCTCISLASVALVLTITNPDFGNNWFWITTLSPLAGAYYWKLASRNEQIKVKMIVIDEGAESEVVVQGDDQQIEQMRKELKLNEKGMVYVKGLFER